MLSLREKSYIKLQAFDTFVIETFIQKPAKDKIHRKVRDHCHYTGKYGGAVHRICNLRHVPNEIPVTFQNESNYYYQFITKELTTDFERKIECLRKTLKTKILLLFPQRKKFQKLKKTVMKVL